MEMVELKLMTIFVIHRATSRLGVSKTRIKQLLLPKCFATIGL